MHRRKYLARLAPFVRDEAPAQPACQEVLDSGRTRENTRQGASTALSQAASNQHIRDAMTELVKCEQAGRALAETESPFQVMPALSFDEYASLKADIAARGVLVPVEYDESGNILDGHHRVQICEELGISQWPRLIRHGLTDLEKLQHARRLNLDRRHLDREQRRQLIAADLLERPSASDRAVGAALGVDHKTVGSVRDELEATGEIPQL